MSGHASGRGEKIEVLNPMGYPQRIEPVRMAARLDRLAGKTVYLIDCRFDDGDILMQQMQDWFHEHMPDVESVLRRKSGVYTERDQALYEEIRARGGAAV